MLLYSKVKIATIYQKKTIHIKDWNKFGLLFLNLLNKHTWFYLFSPVKFHQQIALISCSPGSFRDAKEMSYKPLKSINKCLAETLTVSYHWFRTPVRCHQNNLTTDVLTAWLSWCCPSIFYANMQLKSKAFQCSRL